jgi:hypothetical protein
MPVLITTRLVDVHEELSFNYEGWLPRTNTYPQQTDQAERLDGLTIGHGPHLGIPAHEDEPSPTQQPLNPQSDTMVDRYREPPPPGDPKSQIGVRIFKYFTPNTTRRRYRGTVTKYFPEEKFWHVKYDDGDEEDLEWSELARRRMSNKRVVTEVPVMSANLTPHTKKLKSTRPTAKRRRLRRIASSSESSEDSDPQSTPLTRDHKPPSSKKRRAVAPPTRADLPPSFPRKGEG